MNSHRCSSSPENPASFLLIIPSDMTPSTGIMIPEMFTKKHGKDMLERVTLKVPNGDVWQVDLKRSNGDIWLQNGWWEFVEYYDMKIAYLLMFEYQGFSSFSVVIFDPSSLEIVYPKKTVKDDATKASVSCDDEVEMVELEDDTSSSESEDEDYDEGECSRKIQKITEATSKRIALEKAKDSFKCDKPYFMVYMQKSHLTTNGLVVPRKFRRKLLRGVKVRKCLLRIEKDGTRKTWEVVACEACFGNADWLLFLKDNAITVGDIVAFELIKNHRNVLGVTIFRS